MTFFELREPVSAGTHALWLFLSLPATLILWRRSGPDRGRRLSLLVYGLSLACCYAGSALFHGVPFARPKLELYDRLDHVGIFLLIAGSYTPIAWNLMRARWRFGVLASAWGVAAIGSTMILSAGIMPPLLNTAIYLGMGWGAIFCYVEMAHYLPHRRLFPLVLGGVFYSVGAVLNLLRWPVVVPGVFGPHETFHLFVMAGSLSHYLFMLRVVLPAGPLPAVPDRVPGAITLPSPPARSWFGRLQPVQVRSNPPG